ncbi:MAG: hypothetical protein NTX33_19465 [Propionibacteriales bacterium]|nr:hypothetical protein [Propionibacteriales bacterium]
MNPRAGRLRRMLVLGTAAAGLGLAVVPAVPSASSAPAGGDAAVVSVAAPEGYARTRTITREILDTSGQTDANLSTSYDVTVKANRTTNLRGRERVEISWSGARPSGGRAPNPYGEKGLQQEYPVVVLQCRGTDDADLPAADQVRPESCWTSSWSQRSFIDERYGAWTQDRYAPAADRAPVTGLDPYPAACPTPEPALGSTHITEFVRKDGHVDNACSSTQMPPEAGVDAASPPAEVAAFTESDGKGSVQFEVRSNVENESLGCSDKVACSIVVIPIVGISCDKPVGATLTRIERECRKSGVFAPGSSNALGTADQAVSPALWWSESNWRNRFTVPITFGLPAGVCDVLDPRPPTKFFGSELMAQVALQWAPAYCLSKKRFNFALSQMPDAAGWENMESGAGPAAFVSSEQARLGPDPVGYGPTAVTGFGIAYTIDRPGNGGSYGDLRLNPRLIAKLLTQSYTGSSLGRDHPGMTGNPVAIMTDPEFIDLNPGLSQNAQEAGATLLSLSVSADLMHQLTSYLLTDKDATDFISGKPDQWGMKVNPSYEGMDLPVAEWPLLDTYIPAAEGECLKQNPSVYFTQLAAPVSTLRTIAELLIDGQPNVQTRCEYDPATASYKLGRIERQSFGARFMIGLVSLGDADRFGLRTAALKTSNGRYVEPTESSLSAAVSLMRQGARYEPFAVSQEKLVAAKDAYPGTMVVYTAARLANLEKAQADKVASFIEIATTEGQVRGRGNGELPTGYLPIRRTGATAALWRAAQETATAIRAQEPPAGVTSPQPGSGPGVAPAVPPAEIPGAEVPKGDKGGATVTDGTVPTAATVATESAAGGILLPGLMLIGGLAVASSIVSRVLSARGGRP